MRFYPRTPAGIVMMAAGLAVAAPGLHAQALQTGIISGTVAVSGGGSAKGVQITLSNGQSTVTDEHGFYTFTGVIPGAYTVEASLVGYEPATEDDVVVTQELTSTVNLTLEKTKTTEFGTSTVRTSIIRKDNPSTLYTVTANDEQLVRTTPKDLYMYPGAAISQPGVVPDPNGFPTIRGSRQAGTGYMLDGILLMQPSSGQFATNLSTVGMSRMNVYTGGMRADIGGVDGGFINSVIKTGAQVRGGSIEASTGSLTYAGLVAEAGNVERSGLNWYAATNMFRTDVKGDYAVSELPGNVDSVVKVLKQVGQKNRLTFLGATGYERDNMPLYDPLTGEWLDSTHSVDFDPSRTPAGPGSPTNPWRDVRNQGDYLNQHHAIGSLTWAHSFTPASTLSAQVYGWKRVKDINAMSDWNITDDSVNDKLTAGTLDFTSQISEAFQLRLGGNLIKGNNFDRRAQRGLPGTGRGALLRIRDADTTDLNGYVALTAKAAPRVTVDLGVRYDSRTYHRAITPEEIALGNPAVAAADQETLDKTGMDPRKSAVSPRLGLTFNAGQNTVLRAAAGRYALMSPSNYLENRYLPITMADGGGNPYYYPGRNRKVFDVGPEHTNSVEVGMEHQFGNSLALAVTPYWRTMKDLIARDPSQPGNPFSNAGHGHTHGVETKLTMRERNGWSGWLTYTYQVAKANVFSQSTDQTIVDPEREYRVNYDQRHTVYLVGRYRTGNFEVNPMLELGSGYPWGGQPDAFGAPTGYGYSPDGETLLPILVNGRVQGSEVNPYNTGWHKNLSVTFRLYTSGDKSSYYFLQVQNILNSQDTIQKLWQNPFTGSSQFGYVPGEVTYTDENGATKTSNGHFEYKPWQRVPPIFFLVGARKSF